MTRGSPEAVLVTLNNNKQLPCNFIILLLFSYFAVMAMNRMKGMNAMILCRVVGDVVSTIKNTHLRGRKLLLVQPVELDTETPRGDELIAVDHAQAGEGDLVLVNKEGGGARMLLDDKKIPVQAVIVAVVDDLDIMDEEK